MKARPDHPSLHAVIAEVLRLPPDSVTSATAMRTTGTWDSLRHMELVVTIEEQFGVQLTGGEIAEMTDVGAIEQVLSRHGRMS
jgi:acyl carrier protein